MDKKPKQKKPKKELREQQENKNEKQAGKGLGGLPVRDLKKKPGVRLRNC